jgi:sulfur carrier protein
MISTCTEGGRRRCSIEPARLFEWPQSVTITLNGEPFETAGPLTVTELLNRLDIDARRVAVEHNLVVVKRTAFDVTTIRAGDEVEIVNFVGGG